MTTLKVGIVGATGETGRSIVNAMLEAGGFSIVALTRPTSMSKPANAALAARGVELRPLDLEGSEADIAAALQGLEVIISSIGPMEQLQQLALARAAKQVPGLQRFIPCGFMPCVPAGGTHVFRDQKEVVNNAVRTLRLPYTFLDVGWWYQLAFPRLASGRVDRAVAGVARDEPRITSDGSVGSALTDLRDVGRYVVAVVRDARTLNKSVFVYNEVWSENAVWDALERAAGETVVPAGTPRPCVSAAELEATIAAADAQLEAQGAGFKIDLSTPEGMQLAMGKILSEYMYSLGVRGDNTPENAKYLGYLTSKELYPELKFKGFEEYLTEILEGETEGVYADLKAQKAQKAKHSKK